MSRLGPRPASPLKIQVARMITSDLVGRLIGVLSANRVRNHGLVFDVRSSDFSPRVRAQMFWGIYEGAEIRMIRHLLRGSTTVVELGVTSAHIAVLIRRRQNVSNLKRCLITKSIQMTWNLDHTHNARGHSEGT